MSLGTSFSTSGATPNQTSTPMFGSNAFAQRNAYGTVLGKGTPAGNALNNAYSNPSPAASSLATLSAPFSTPVKSTKITHPDGTVVEQTSHAPGGDTTSSTPGVLGKTNPAIPANPATPVTESPSAAPVPPAPVTLAPAQTTPTSTYSGLINRGVNALDQEALAKNAIANDPNFSIETQLGKEGQAQQSLAGQATAAFTGASAAAPVQVPYSNQFVDPTTGQPIGGGQSGQLPQQAQDFVTSLAQQVKSNALSRADAESKLSTYGPIGIQALNAALGSDFNTNVAGAQGSSAADLTTSASELQSQANGAEANFNLLANIAKQGGVNDGNVPILNTIQQNVAKGLASNEAVVNFKSILQSVRDQYAAILGGGTVTDAGRAEALSLIPDNVSLSALQSVGQNLKSDAGNRIAGIQNQVKSLTNSGSSSSGSNSSSGFGWNG